MKKIFEDIQKMTKENTGETKDYGSSLMTFLGVILVAMSFYVLFLGMDHIYFPFLLGIGGFLLVDGNNWLINKRNLIFEEISSLNADLDRSKNKVDDIENILAKIERIGSLVKDLLRNSSFSKIFYSSTTKKEQNKIIHKELFLLIQYIYDLQSDLMIRLREQEIILEGTEDNVRSVVKGTKELEHVSELQKLRLDRQIEQFEELQRVLVKV